MPILLLFIQFACVVVTVAGLRGSRSAWVPLAFFGSWFPFVGWAIAAYALLRSEETAPAPQVPVRTLPPQYETNEALARGLLTSMGLRVEKEPDHVQ